MMTNRFLFVIAAAIALTAPAAAQGTRWNRMLVDSSTALKSGDYKRSLKLSSRVVDEMVDTLGPGSNETEAFAVALTHKALANAGLSRFDDALWDWHVAVGILPTMANADMSAFGPAGQY